MTRNIVHIFALFFVSILTAQTALIRNPSLSPDGKELAFSYQGDIWLYHIQSKQYNRLTVHEAYESNPVWNPKGTHLAFSSNRKGANNIFTIPKSGGIPSQLTYYPTTDTPYDWTAQDNILFTTNRVLKGPEWDAQTYHVTADGGTPERTLSALGSMATESPNGKLIAFVKGACRISREDYSGSAQRDIWVYNKETEQYLQITDTPKNDHSPLWDASGNLYFIGAESGRYNIYKQALSGNGKASGEPIKLTQQTKNGVVSYSVSDDGTIVFSTLFNLYQIKEGKLNEIQLNLNTDYRFELEKTSTNTAGISTFDISPDGKLAALEIDGEIFVKENDKDKKNRQDTRASANSEVLLNIILKNKTWGRKIKKDQ